MLQVVCDKCNRVLQTTDKIRVSFVTTAGGLSRGFDPHMCTVFCERCITGTKTEQGTSNTESAPAPAPATRKRRRTMTTELRKQILQEISEAKLPNSEIAQKYDVSLPTVYRLSELLRKDSQDVDTPAAPEPEVTEGVVKLVDAQGLMIEAVIRKAELEHGAGTRACHFQVITELYEKNVPSEVIANRLGVTVNFVDRFIRKKKLAVSNTIRELAGVDIGKVLALSRAGWKPKDIAGDMHTDVSAIAYVLEHRSQFEEQLTGKNTLDLDLVLDIGTNKSEEEEE